MQLRTLFVGIALGVGAALITSQAIPQDNPGTAAALDQEMQQAAQDEMAAMMEQWMKLTAPGQYHELMKGLLGEWNTTTEMYWSGPGTDPVITHGKSSRKMVLGGRFMLQEENSTMMMPDPAGGEPTATPWNGMGLFGYDNYRNMYVGCWADSMGTQLLTMKGMADPTGKIFTYFGEMDEPMLGVIGRTVKYVTTIVDENTNTFEIYDLHAGDDYKVFRVTYERVKKAE